MDPSFLIIVGISGYIVADWSKIKGRNSFIAWFIYGAMLPGISLIHVIILIPKYKVVSNKHKATVEKISYGQKFAK